MPVVRYVGCWAFTRFSNLSPLSPRPARGAACLVAFLLAARRRISFSHAAGIGWDALEGAELLGHGERAPNGLLDKAVPLYCELCLHAARSRAPSTVVRLRGNRSHAGWQVAYQRDAAWGGCEYCEYVYVAKCECTCETRMCVQPASYSGPQRCTVLLGLLIGHQGHV